MSREKVNKIIRLSTPLKRLMEETGLKSSQLAELVGVQRSNLSNYLHDSANASTPVLLHFAELARSQELRDLFYGMAGKTADLGRTLFSVKVESYRHVSTNLEIADEAPRYSPDKSAKGVLQGDSTEVITVPCVPPSLISNTAPPTRSVSLRAGFQVAFEKNQLFRMDPLGIWTCTRMPADDDSMVNVLQPGDLLLVNKRFSVKSKSTGGKIFLVRVDRRITARRIILEKDAAVLIADNRRYASRFMEGLHELENLVIGQIVWKGGEVK